MPFPGAGERKPPAKKGKSRSRRYAISWVYREEDSNDDEQLYVNEVKSTNIQSAVTALLRTLNDGEDEKLKKSDIVVVEVRVLARGETVEAA
jgi:hypothetical protein